MRLPCRATGQKPQSRNTPTGHFDEFFAPELDLHNCLTNRATSNEMVSLLLTAAMASYAFGCSNAFKSGIFRSPSQSQLNVYPSWGKEVQYHDVNNHLRPLGLNPSMPSKVRRLKPLKIMYDPSWFGDSMFFMVQGVSDGILGVGRNLENVVEDIDVIQSTTQMVTAGKLANEIIPFQTMFNNAGSSSQSAKGIDSDQGTRDANCMDDLSQTIDKEDEMLFDDDDDHSEVDEIPIDVAEDEAVKVETVQGAKKQPRYKKSLKHSDDPEGQGGEVETDSEVETKSAHSTQHTNDAGAAASSPKSEAQQPSSPAAQQSPAQIRLSLLHAFQLDPASPTDIETLDRLLTTLDLADLAAFLPPTPHMPSLRMAVHLARAQRAAADRAHELDMAQALAASSTRPAVPDPEAEQRLYRAAVRPARPPGASLAEACWSAAQAWAAYVGGGGALSHEDRYHILAGLLLPDEARAFRTDPAVGWRAISARPAAGETAEERAGRFGRMLGALAAFCDRHPGPMLASSSAAGLRSRSPPQPLHLSAPASRHPHFCPGPYFSH
jgi:hypothetical protein